MKLLWSLSLAILLGITLVGCATPTYTHRAKSAQEQQTDKAECMAMAGSAGAGWGMLIVREQRRDTAYRACMEGRGYALVE